MIAVCEVWAILLSEAMGTQWGDCEIHYQTPVDSSCDLKFSFEKSVVAEHKTMSALMIRLSFASFEGAFLCWRPVIKILWLPKSHWQLNNIWAPVDEHMELPCVEEIAMNVHRFLHFFFLANHWLKIVQPYNSVTLLVPGKSTVSETKLNGWSFLPPTYSWPPNSRWVHASGTRRHQGDAQLDMVLLSNILCFLSNTEVGFFNLHSHICMSSDEQHAKRPQRGRK